MDPKGIAVVIGILLAFLLGPVWYLENAFLVTSKITIHQVEFWIMLVFVPSILYLIEKYKKKGVFSWPITALWSAFLFVYFTIGTFYTSGIADKSNFNAQAMGGIWEESYTSTRTETVCDAKDKDGSCTSSHTVTHCDNHHPDSYTILFSDDSSHSIGGSNYRNLVQALRNEKQVPNSNIDQCSIGDGRKFTTNYIGDKSTELYVTYEKPVVNYILAGHNLYQTSDQVAKPYLDHLEKVPGITEHSAGIGPWMSHRIITKGVQVPATWKEMMNGELNKLNGTLGPSKEINVVMYVVGTPNREFMTALDAHWVHGRKNQLTIIVGSTTFPNIEWVDVIDFWSMKPEIRINLRDQLEKFSLDDPRFMQVIKERIQTDWQRREMKTFEYLSWDIALPWWMYPLVLIFCLAMSWLFSRLFKAFFEN